VSPLNTYLSFSRGLSLARFLIFIVLKAPIIIRAIIEFIISIVSLVLVSSPIGPPSAFIIL
jgi:hypothetical protein